MANARAKPKASAKTTVKSVKAAKSGKAVKATKPVKPLKAAKPLAKVAKPARLEKSPRVEKAVVAEQPPRTERPAKVERIEVLDTKPSAQAEPFRLVAIERTEPPSGAAGKNWFRYTIRQGGNAINGFLQGTAAGVKTAAEQIVGQLNERRAGRWGYRTTRAAAPAQSSS
jgi:hypothetical protein